QGNAQLVIGTHALLEEKVEFSKPGLVIVDEQHRFGVMQRLRLMKKSGDGQEGSRALLGTTGSHTPSQKGTRVHTAVAEPDVLVMTATPIPRTLALTLYGDLDLSVLDELPPGRIKIITRAVSPRDRGQTYEFIRQELIKGRQAFVIC